MDPAKPTIVRRIRTYVASHLSHEQHRNAYFLMLNSILNACVGIVFWLVIANMVHEDEVGIGFSVIALGTIVAVIAKGGLDTALIRTIPSASRQGAIRLLWFAVVVGGFGAVAFAALIAVASSFGLPGTQAMSAGWLLVFGIAFLLVTTWLQDAYFLAEGNARYSFLRNVVFSVARLVLPIPIILFALPRPVGLIWALALLASAAPAILWVRRFPAREGRPIPKKEYLRSAVRNVSGGAAEFLPGLVLAPLVLALNGPADAAYFGMAWTGASLLFLLSASISRSALSEMVRKGQHALAVGRAVRHQLTIVIPGAIAGIALAPQVLSLFGAEYAANGAAPFMILCASIVFVAPAFTYLAVLRAQEKPLALVVFPIVMIAALLALAPPLLLQFGLPGVALAWLLANAPIGIYGAWKLRQGIREVIPHAQPPTVNPTPRPE